MRNISKLSMLLLAPALALSGCKDTSGRTYMKKGTFEGYEVTIEFNGENRKINVHDKDGYLYAKDWDDDGRFDDIKLKAPKGSPVEKFTNLSELERAYSEVDTNGKVQ